MNRLKSVTEPGGKVTGYTFDGSGNRLTETITEGSTVSATGYSYDAQNRLVSTGKTVNGSDAGGASYFYDNNGNMVGSASYALTAGAPMDAGIGLSMLGGQGAEKTASLYEYDKRNNMVKAVSGADITAAKYNGDGLRVEKTVNNVACRYLYEYDKIVLETDASGNQTARNVYGTNLLKRQMGSDSFTYMYDGHGDVTALLGQSGAVAVQYYYDAFGVITEETASVNNPFRYSGYEYDSGSGLYYLKARYYDPAIARFMQEDTNRGSINDPLSLNLYAYCNNEPIMYQDPSGHGLVGAIIGGIIGGIVGGVVGSIVGSVIGDIATGGYGGGSSGSGSNTSSVKSSSGMDVMIINQSWGYQTALINSSITYAGNTYKSYIEITAGGYKYKIYEGVQYFINDNGKAIYYNKDSNAVREVAMVTQGANYKYEDVKLEKVKDGLWGSTISIKGLYEGDKTLKEGIDYYRDPTGKAYFYDAVRTLNEAKGNTVNYDNKTKAITITDKNGNAIGDPLKPGDDYYIGRDGKAYSTQGIPASFITVVRVAFQNSARGGDYDGAYGLQCPDLVNWFIATYTTLEPSTGSGYAKAANVVNANKEKLSAPSNTPEALSVFSVAGGPEYKNVWNSSGSVAGHTGIVLSVDEINKTATVIHTGNKLEDKTPNSWISIYSYPASGVTFTHIGEYMNK